MNTKNFAIAILLLAGSAAAEPIESRKHALPKATQGGTVVGLCDGKTNLEVKDLKPGATMSRQKAQAVSDELMARWQKAHPEVRWDNALAQNSPPAPPPGSNRAAQGPSGQSAGVAAQGEAGAPMGAHVQAGTYESETGRDELVWAAETQKFVDGGSQIFHDAGKLGGTIGVSCDMCHPNGANTHPETYPKFQVQLGRVALLRDMINWCIENPVKGKALRDGDDRLRALEAYIIAQRKGVKLEYGKR